VQNRMSRSRCRLDGEGRLINICRGGSRGVTTVTITPWRGSLFHVIIMRVTNSQTLKFHSSVSPDPLNAHSLRSLGFPKSPPSKNHRSANAMRRRCGLWLLYSNLFFFFTLLGACKSTSKTESCRRARFLSFL